MGNIVLRLCKETKGYTDKKIAGALGISPQQYAAMETGEELMTHEQAVELGKLYQLKGEYFFTAALQLDALLTRREIIRILKQKNDRLEEQLKKKRKANPAKVVKKAKTKTNPRS